MEELNMDKKLQNIEVYQKLVDSIGNTIEGARRRAYTSC